MACRCGKRGMKGVRTVESVFEEKEKCSGCGACKSACAAGAITMQPDDNGFYYPAIHAERCVDCGQCRNVCHFHHKNQVHRASETVFAVQSKDPKVLKTSQSGGIFAELARSVLRGGGVVYGAAFNASYEVGHIRIDSDKQLYKLQGSKYVQSKTEGLFEAVKTDLGNCLEVLFSGTPCQVAALYSYIGAETKLLYTVDLVCHGVMPPSLWRDYLDYIKRKYGAITSANFRDKSFGWEVHDESFIAGRRKIRKNVYRKIFYKDLLLRPSCYRREEDALITACKYSGMSRVSDLTIGDFWGIRRAASAFENTKDGISLCIINSERGQRLFESIKPRTIWEEKDAGEAVRRQPHLSGRGNRVPASRVETARAEYREKGFLYIASKYGENGVRGMYPKGIRFIKHLRNRVLKNGNQPGTER